MSVIGLLLTGLFVCNRPAQAAHWEVLYITNGAGSERKVFDGKFDCSCPVDADVEDGYDISKTRFKSVPGSVREVLEVENASEQGKDRFHDYALVPLAFLADFAVDGVAFFSVEAAVAQHAHFFLHFFKQRMKCGIVDIGGFTLPVHDSPLPVLPLPVLPLPVLPLPVLPLPVAKQAQLGTDDPAMIAFAFLPICFSLRLSRCAFLTWDGSAQLNAERIADAEESWMG